MEAIDWIAARWPSDRAEGREPMLAETKGEAEVAGVTLYGGVDRIDRLPDGRLAIVDYKTGQAPGQKAVAEGFRAAARPAVADRPRRRIRRRQGRGRRSRILVAGEEEWPVRLPPVTRQGRRGRGVRRSRLCPFRRGRGQMAARRPSRSQAKLNPAYAPYEDYDQLMRLEEWYGRD